jgi:small-conductance mechanosensitive channel
MTTSTQTAPSTELVTERPVSIRGTLSALWAATMFLFIYADIQGLVLQPGSLERIQAGEIGGFEITQGWLFGVAVLMTIPALMVALSYLLPKAFARWLNVVAGIVYTVVALGAVLAPDEGGVWAFYLFYSAVEIILTVTITVLAWRWPRAQR